MDERWIATLVANQDIRAKLPGDSKNPLVTKAEKRQKQLKKEMTKWFTIQNVDNLFAQDGQASSPMSDNSTLRSVSSE